MNNIGRFQVSWFNELLQASISNSSCKGLLKSNNIANRFIANGNGYRLNFKEKNKHIEMPIAPMTKWKINQPVSFPFPILFKNQFLQLLHERTPFHQKTIEKNNRNENPKSIQYFFILTIALLFINQIAKKAIIPIKKYSIDEYQEATTFSSKRLNKANKSWTENLVFARSSLLHNHVPPRNRRFKPKNCKLSSKYNWQLFW